MRFIKYLALIVIISSGFDALSQTEADATIYYKYELIPTGELSENSDTVYEVFFKIKNEDILTLKSLTIIRGDKEKSFSLEADSIRNVSRFERVETDLRINIDKWSGSFDWLVVGENTKSERVYLKHFDEKDRRSLNVIDTVIIPKKRTRPDKEKKVTKL